MLRRIVKYSNRRLYDPTDGRQITLIELSELVLAGEEITVEEKRSGTDITAVTVLQSVIERMRRTPRGAPRGRMAERILEAVRAAMERGTADAPSAAVSTELGEGG
jgi:polyhydroxyalkanoate synthesis regulator protein